MGNLRCLALAVSEIPSVQSPGRATGPWALLYAKGQQVMGSCLGSASCPSEHNPQLALQLHPEPPALHGLLNNSKCPSLSWTGYRYPSSASEFGDKVYLGPKEPPLLPTAEGLKWLAILEILCWFYQLQEIILKPNSCASAVMLSSKKQFLYIWQVLILLSSQLPLIVLAKQPLINHLYAAHDSAGWMNQLLCNINQLWS